MDVNLGFEIAYMKHPEAYKILIVDATVDAKQSVTLKLVAGNHQKTIKPFTFTNRSQHINFEWIIFESVGTATMEMIRPNPSQPVEIDLVRPKQVVDILGKEGNKYGTVTVEVEHLTEYPKEKSVFFAKQIQLQFTVGMSPNKDLLLVLKYGDKYHKTSVKTPEQIVKWGEEFEMDPDEALLNIYAECWTSDGEYVGTAIVPIQGAMNKCSGHPIRDIKDIEVGALSLSLLNVQHQDKLHHPIGQKRLLKIYVLEALLNTQLKHKTQTFIKLHSDRDENLSTTSVFSDARNPKWNQSFQVDIGREKTITFQLCERHEEEGKQEAIAVVKMNAINVSSGKEELSLELIDGSEVGKLYIQVQCMSPQQSHKSPPSKPAQSNEETPASPRDKSRSPPSKPIILPPGVDKTQTMQRLKQMKAKYTGQSLYDYYNINLNQALKQGLKVIARQKPTDPVRELGLFLINYQK